MNDFKLETPVVFLIFNRLDTTARIFEAIRVAQQQALLVVAYRAREDWLSGAKKCAAARAVVERVDWTCEVLENFSDVNCGCAAISNRESR